MNSFKCANCGKSVSLKAPGTKNRNHCPFCLYSVHVDGNIPGDRASTCHGLMKPINKFLRPSGEEVIVHKCIKCGFERWNRVAGDDVKMLRK
jgi:DNA-directed RNA polymerase subunit RPC12/RpoP